MRLARSAATGASGRPAAPATRTGAGLLGGDGEDDGEGEDDGDGDGDDDGEGDGEDEGDGDGDGDDDGDGEAGIADGVAGGPGAVRDALAASAAAGMEPVTSPRAATAASTDRAIGASGTRGIVRVAVPVHEPPAGPARLSVWRSAPGPSSAGRRSAAWPSTA